MPGVPSKDEATDGATAVPSEVVAARAREIVLRQLSDGPRTAQQLRDRMTARDIPESVADAVVARFAEVGLVDDRAFAVAWVRSRHEYKGLGTAVLRQELRRKGVADEFIVEALSEVTADAEFDRAVELARRKAPSVRALPSQKQVQRLAGFLARKGYPSSVVFAAVRVALGETPTLSRLEEDDETDDS
jgi:regulatory protein